MLSAALSAVFFGAPVVIIIIIFFFTNIKKDIYIIGNAFSTCKERRSFSGEPKRITRRSAEFAFQTVNGQLYIYEETKSGTRPRCPQLLERM